MKNLDTCSHVFPCDTLVCKYIFSTFLFPNIFITNAVELVQSIEQIISTAFTHIIFIYVNAFVYCNLNSSTYKD